MLAIFTLYRINDRVSCEWCVRVVVAAGAWKRRMRVAFEGHK